MGKILGSGRTHGLVMFLLPKNMLGHTIKMSQSQMFCQLVKVLLVLEELYGEKL